MCHKLLFAAPVFLTLAILSSGAYAQAAAGGAIAAVDAPAGYRTPAAGGRSEGAPTGAVGKIGTEPLKSSTTVRGTKRIPSPKPTPAKPAPSPAPEKWDGPVLGDKYTFLNFEVISAAKPYYTREAKANGAKGLVQVEILIGTDGRVISARARTGNPLLHPEAERAALESRFNRPTAFGKPARAMGFLVYRFGPAED